MGVGQDVQQQGKKSNLLSNAGGIVGGLTTLAGWLGIGEKRQDKRQLDQQGKLNEQQEASNKRMADYEQELKMKMWKDTNYTAQLAEASKAGVSKAAAIGGSGTGTQGASVSGISGGTASDASSAMNAGTARGAAGLQTAAQLNLMKAQADNLNADTQDKLANLPNKGTQNELGQEDLKTKKFNNGVLEKLGVDRVAGNEIDKMVQTEADSGKAWDEYQAWKAAGFGEGNTNDKNSPIAKAISAGFQETITRVQNARKDGRMKEAQIAVEEYKANLAKQGIPPDSPWGLKLAAAIAEKLGILPKGK